MHAAIPKERVVEKLYLILCFAGDVAMSLSNSTPWFFVVSIEAFWRMSGGFVIKYDGCSGVKSRLTAVHSLPIVASLQQFLHDLFMP
jgi:hypothetical protein